MLGVGAAVTVAAWNDSEYVDATITAGTFQIEGSITSGSLNFSDHAVSTSSAALSFSSPVTAITPGTTTYAAFWVRTKATSVAGTVTMQTPTFGASTGLQTSLTYAVRLVPTTQTCNASVFATTPIGTQIVAAGTTLNATLTSPASVVAAAGATPLQYCFAITLPGTADNSAQGLSAIPNWQFLATAS